MTFSQKCGIPANLLGLVRDINNLLLRGAGPFSRGEPTPVELLSPSDKKLLEQLKSQRLGRILDAVLPRLNPAEQKIVLERLLLLMLNLGVVEPIHVKSFPYD